MCSKEIFNVVYTMKIHHKEVFVSLWLHYWCLVAHDSLPHDLQCRPSNPHGLTVTFTVWDANSRSHLTVSSHGGSVSLKLRNNSGRHEGISRNLCSYLSKLICEGNGGNGIFSAHSCARMRAINEYCGNLVPRASFPLTSGRKTRALGAVLGAISGSIHFRHAP